MMINEYLHWIVSNNRFSNAYEKLIYFELADRTDSLRLCLSRVFGVMGYPRCMSHGRLLWLLLVLMRSR